MLLLQLLKVLFLIAVFLLPYSGRRVLVPSLCCWRFVKWFLDSFV